MLGVGNIQHAHSIAQLNKLLKSDYRGIIVSTIHKFQGMPADLNTRPNIFVMIDEAHRTTGGDLGVYLMAAYSQRGLHRLHRHSGGQNGLRQRDVQDLWHRR
jgi:type I site-specific restriction-modification system R (restriction) subunit